MLTTLLTGGIQTQTSRQFVLKRIFEGVFKVNTVDKPCGKTNVFCGFYLHEYSLLNI